MRLVGSGGSVEEEGGRGRFFERSLLEERRTEKAFFGRGASLVAGGSVSSEGWMTSDSVGGASDVKDRSCLSSSPSLSMLWVDLLSCGDGRGEVGFEERFPFVPPEGILRKARRGTPREMPKNGE